MTPDGWKPVSVRWARFNRSPEPHVSIGLEGVTTFSSHCTVFIDNRNGPAHQVQIGKLKIQVAADSKAYYLLKPPQEEANSQVLLDDQSIGRMRTKRTITWLIDPTGNRKYEFYTRSYSAFGLGPNYGNTSEKHHRSKLHEIGGTVNYFLEHAPYEIKSSGGSTIKGALVEDE